jgi:prophage regulatory protein
MTSAGTQMSNAGTKLISYKQLAKMGVPFCRNHLRRMMSTGKFPAAVQISERRIAWVEGEVREWIAARLTARNVAGRHAPEEGRSNLAA